jgi:superfamily II DNA/RNA helicase
MLDMGFGVQIDRIVKFLPANRQTLMFSATLPAEIIKMSAKYLKSPERIAVGSTSQPILAIQQEIIQVSEANKYEELLKQLGARTGSIIVFVKTKRGAEKMCERLNKLGHVTDTLHGDLHQRKREKVIQAYRDRKFRILVATDIAARGLDIPHIEHVINYDLPQCPEDYIHRIGRTARNGSEGSAVCLISPEDGLKWRDIHKLLHPGEPAPHMPHAPSGARGGYKGKSNGGGYKGKKPNGGGDNARRFNRGPRNNRTSATKAA